MRLVVSVIALSVAQAFAQTTINTNTVTVSNPGTFAGGLITFAGNGTLSLTGSGTLANNITFNAGVSGTISNGVGLTDTLSGQLSGSGALVKSGTGLLILTGAATHAGGTTISAGTLQVGNGGTGGSIVGNVVDNGALIFNKSNDLTLAGTISGSGSISKQGAGVLTLTGANTYAGGTTLSAGTLAAGSSSALGRGTVTINGGTLLGTTDLTLANNLVLSNSFTLAAQAGTTLTVGTPTNSIANGSTMTIGSTGANGTVLLKLSGNNTIPNAMNFIVAGGTFKAVDTMFGTALLPSFNSLQIDAGATLDIGGFSATMPIIALSGTGRITSSSGNPVALFRGGSFAGTIDSALSLQAHIATTTLTGDNSYTGGTSIFGQATLQLGNGGTSGSIVGNVSNLGTLTFNRSNAVTFSGAISGSGTLSKLGAGILTLTGTNTYSGGTTISAGTLQVGDGGTTGSIAGNVTNNGTLTFNRNNAVRFSGAISGSGTLSKLGAGVLTIAGANTYSGGTTISAGTLQLGDGGSAGSITGDVTNNGTLAFNRIDAVTFSGAISGNGALTKLGAGVLTLSGRNTYSGGTELRDGTLAVGALAVGSGVVNITDGTLLGTGSMTLTNVLVLSNNPTIAAQTGTTLTVSGAAGSAMFTDTALTIGTADAEGAVLWNPAGGIGSVGSNITIAGGTFKAANGRIDNLLFPAASLQLNAGTTLDIAGFETRLPTMLSGAGRITSSSGNPVLYLRGGSFGGTIDSALQIDVRQGLTTFTGTSSYGGGTAIIAGATLQLGDGGATGSIVGDVNNDGTLVFNRSDNILFAGAISGPGTLRKQGAGTLTLGPATTTVGSIDVAMGGLQLPTGLTVTNAVTNQGNIGFAGTLSIGGSLGNSGALTLNGATLNGAATLANYNLLSGYGSIGGSGGFSNYGQVTPFGGGLALSNTGSNVNYGNWDVPAGLPLTLSGAALTNAGLVNLAGGLINGDGMLVNGPNGTVAGRGTIAATFSNQGLLALTGGTLAINGAFASSGQIQLSSGTALLTGGELANSGRVEGVGKVNNTVTNSGTIETAGGTLTMGGGVFNRGLAQARSGTLVFSGSLSNAASGIIAADAGAKVVATTGLASNAGQIQLAGGTFDNNGTALTNDTTGVISGFGTLRGGAITNNGQVLLSGGTSAVRANVVGNGGSQIVLSGNSNTTFYGVVEVKNGAELRVSDGSVATFFGQVNQRNGALLTGSGAKLYEAGFAVGNSPGLGTDAGNVSFGSANVYEAEIGGNNPGGLDGTGIQFDRYVVGGTLTFGGTLKVVQYGGFAPQAGQTFDLFDWGTRQGQFSTIDFTAAPLASGLTWDTSHLYTDGTLTVAAVPEPGTYAMFAAGLGLMGFMVRRRRQRQAA